MATVTYITRYGKLIGYLWQSEHFTRPGQHRAAAARRTGSAAASKVLQSPGGRATSPCAGHNQLSSQRPSTGQAGLSRAWAHYTGSGTAGQGRACQPALCLIFSSITPGCAMLSMRRLSPRALPGPSAVRLSRCIATPEPAMTISNVLISAECSTRCLLRDCRQPTTNWRLSLPMAWPGR